MILESVQTLTKTSLPGRANIGRVKHPRVGVVERVRKEVIGIQGSALSRQSGNVCRRTREYLNRTALKRIIRTFHWPIFQGSDEIGRPTGSILAAPRAAVRDTRVAIGGIVFMTRITIHAIGIGTTPTLNFLGAVKDRRPHITKLVGVQVAIVG